MEGQTQEELRLSEVFEYARYISDIAAKLMVEKQDGKSIRHAVDVLDKDADTLKSMIYALYILAQNNEDPI